MRPSLALSITLKCIEGIVSRIVLATRNQDKVKEIQELLSGSKVSIVTLNEFPDAPEVVEDGKTLEENAIKKAKVVSEFTGMPAVADDTGLEVDYLNGEPGVFSSRYSGENATYADNVNKLLEELEGIPWQKRGARFRCVVAFHSNHVTKTVEGVCEGLIAEQPKGEDGFGYDPVFYVPEYECTFAEMSLELKNQISHRAKAFLKLKTLLQNGDLI